MDEVIVEVEKTKIEWEDANEKTIQHIKAIQEYGESRRGNREEKTSLLGLNRLAQDGLSLLNSLKFNLDLLAPQLPSDDHVQSTMLLLETWKNQYDSLWVDLASANLQANDNMRKSAQEEIWQLHSKASETTGQYSENWTGRETLLLRRHMKRFSELMPLWIDRS